MAEIKCPNCGHNEVNVAIWGSAEVEGTFTTDIRIADVVSVNIDRHESARCTQCDHEADYSEFKEGDSNGKQVADT